MKLSPLFLLFIVFLILKLTDVIAWSWWWVTAPLWIPCVGVFGIWLIVVMIATGVYLVTKGIK